MGRLFHILGCLAIFNLKEVSIILRREELNRDIRNKKAIACDILASIPDNYNATWREAKLSELYAEVSKAQEHNNKLEQNKAFIANVEDKGWIYPT